MQPRFLLAKFSTRAPRDASEWLVPSQTRRTDLMVACYPGGGAAYGPHVDNADGDGRQARASAATRSTAHGRMRSRRRASGHTDARRTLSHAHAHAARAPSPDGAQEEDYGRCFTAVLYLNTKWDEDNGGALRVFLPKESAAEERDVVDVYPHGDTLVLFRADRVVHEVRPAHAERLAMTVWMYAGSKEQQRRQRAPSGR